MQNILRSIIVTLLLMLMSTLIIAQDDSDAFTPSPELDEYLTELEGTTVGIRSLPKLEDVTRVFPTKEDVAAYLQAVIAEELTPEIANELTQFYVAFDFIEPGAPFFDLYLELLEDQVGGYYDPEVKEMNTILLSGRRPNERLPLLEQIIYVHEFVHALQDQHFDLAAILDDAEANEDNPDRVQAIISLVEGDATAVMNEYTVIATEENPIGALVEILLAGANTGSLTIPEGIPAIMEAELLSPYLDGSIFVSALKAEGGWDMVDAAYDNLPESTEQILHPRKYLEGESPIEVEMLDGEGLLGDTWQLLFDRPMGEFFLREYLYTQLSVSDARAAAAGWGGDRYHLYYDAENDQRAWVMRLVWDDLEEAEEFNAAYEAFGESRFDAEQDEVGCWSNAVDAICFMVEADGSSLIAYAPTETTAQILIDHQRVAIAVD